jgi:hypothetical protein
MRVFVTGTGRCGSVCFKHACEHIENYTCGHETYNGLLEYPDNHIEINPQFRHNLYTLVKKYPTAKFVHLIREREACINSLLKLNDGLVVESYRILYPSIMENASPRAAAERFYDAENELIRMQINKASNMTIYLESAKEQWAAFWDWIGATGDRLASTNEWDHPRNTSKERQEK